jgi:hypothetical protein
VATAFTKLAQTFRGTLLAATLFAVAFGAMPLSYVSRIQNERGWSALRAGLATGSDPLMAPPMTAVAGLLIRRLGSAPDWPVDCDDQVRVVVRVGAGRGSSADDPGRS